MADENREKNSNSNKEEKKPPRSGGGMAPTKTRDISGNTRGKI